MPRISYFLGISIYMYYDEHNPPHFHAVYNEHGGIINIKEKTLMKGELPKKVLSLILEWTEKYEKDLLEDWDRAVDFEELLPIPPLV